MRMENESRVVEENASSCEKPAPVNVERVTVHHADEGIGLQTGEHTIVTGDCEAPETVDCVAESDPIHVNVEANNQRHNYDVETKDEERHEKAMDWMAVVVGRLSGQVRKELINDLFSALRDKSFCLKSFLEKYPTAYKCKKRMNDIVNESMECFGYERIEFTEEASKLSGHIYLRDAAVVIQNQVSKANDDECHYFPFEKTSDDGERVFGNMMHTDFAARMYASMRRQRIASPNADMYWKDKGKHEVPHFPAFLQIYSDKTATTLKSGAVVGYPLHVSLLNFESRFRCKRIKENDTVVGYLSEEYITEQESTYEERGGTNDGSARTRKACILNEAMRLALKPIVDSLEHGIPVENRNGTKALAISALVNYTADIPEGKQMSAVLHGSNTSKPCIRCLVHGKELNSLSKYPRREMSDTKKVRRTYEKCMADMHEAREKNFGKRAAKHKEMGKEELKKQSLFVVPSFLENTLLLRPNPRIQFDAYAIFSYEVLHNLHLGVSKDIKKVIFERLGSETKRAKQRTFRSIRKTVLKGVNDMLRSIDQQYYAPNLRVDFSKPERSTRLNGFYIEDGIRGMLEAKDFQRLDMVFPFAATFIDRMCCEEKEHPITKICVIYSDLVSKVLRYEKPKYWAESEIEEVESMCHDLRKRMLSTLAEFHTSNFRTLKFHMLSHIGEDIRRYGGLHNTEAGTYENSHLMFKNAYRRTSKRTTTAIRETLQRLSHGHMVREATNYLKGNSEPEVQEERVQKSLPYLVKKGPQCTLLQLCMFFDAACNVVGDFDIVPEDDLQELSKTHPEACVQILKQCSMSQLQVLCDLLGREMQRQEQCSPDKVKLTVLKSGYVEGGHAMASSTSYDAVNDVLQFRKSSITRRQRIIASTCFQNREVFSYVAVKAKEGVWIGQIRVLLRVQFTGNSEEEIIFLRYMDVVPANDDIERTLDCIMLRWSCGAGPEHLLDQRNGPMSELSKLSETDEVMETTPWLGIAPFNSILSRVHVVRTNVCSPVFDERLHWMFHRFCINRFYYEGSENLLLEE